MVRGAIPQAGSDTQDWATHGDATPTKEACIVTIDGLATAVNTGDAQEKTPEAVSRNATEDMYDATIIVGR